MNGIEFLADTNAVIYLLAGNSCMEPYLQKSMAISVISFMELLSFPGISEVEEKKIREFVGTCKIFQIDEAVRERTIQLRRKYKIKLPDAIIAATSLVYDLSLISADVGFCKIEGLKMEILNP